MRTRTTETGPARRPGPRAPYRAAVCLALAAPLLAATCAAHGLDVAPASMAATVGEPTAPCRAASTTMVLGPPHEEAGTVYRQLRLTNSGTRPCALQGFLDVAFVADDLYRPIGAPAEREGQQGGEVMLPPRSTASAAIGMVKIERFAAAECRRAAAKGLRVYLPFDMTPAFVAAPGSACTGKTPDAQLKVRRFETGT